MRTGQWTREAQESSAGQEFKVMGRLAAGWSPREHRQSHNRKTLLSRFRLKAISFLNINNSAAFFSLGTSNYKKILLISPAILKIQDFKTLFLTRSCLVCSEMAKVATVTRETTAKITFTAFSSGTSTTTKQAPLNDNATMCHVMQQTENLVAGEGETSTVCDILPTTLWFGGKT